MLKFDIDDPYPLLSESLYTHAEAKEHAKSVDEWLGFDTETVEQAVLIDERYNPFKTNVDRPFLSEYWRGLPIESLQTPYVELRGLIEALNLSGKETMIDLGSGYSRMAFVLQRHHSNVKFIGIEFVEPRHKEALRVLEKNHMQNATLLCQDLSAECFALALADIYFIYDFGSKPAIRKTLSQIQEIARSQSVKVVGRGRSSRDLIEKENPWLSQINGARHFRNFSIYSS